MRRWSGGVLSVVASAVTLLGTAPAVRAQVGAPAAAARAWTGAPACRPPTGIVPLTVSATTPQTETLVQRALPPALARA